MLDERFAYGSSPLHTLDPRAKICAATAFSCVVAVCQQFPVLLAALGLGAVVLLSGGLPLRAVGKRLLAVNIFILLLWIVVPFSMPGTPVFSVLGFTATQEAINLTTRITIKSNAIILVLTALIATTPVPALGHALRKLHVPQKLGWLLIFTYRQIFIIAKEFQRLSAAMKVRGFTPRTNMHTYRAYASLLGMVLVRSLDRSERVYQAMVCRGFNGAFHSLNGLAMTTRDVVFLALMLALTCALAAGELLIP